MRDSRNDKKTSRDAADILKTARIEVMPETYTVVSLSSDQWQQLLENPELSPRMTVPFMIFKDKWEVTLVLDDEDFDTIRDAVRDSHVEQGFRLLSFDAELDFNVVGFIARIAGILAESGISILPISSYSRDHVLVRQIDLGAALKALRGHVAEVC